jgi:hypothetical protein
MATEDRLQQRMLRIAELVQQLDSAADAKTKAQFKELLESVMELHREALERVLEALRALGDAGEKLLASLAEDPAVAGVLLLYGLHPLDFETRVRCGIDKAAPILRSYGARAEAVSIKNGAVRIRISGAADAFTARTVKSAIEEELYAVAPDAASVVLLGLEKFTAPDFVPLEKLGVMTTGSAGD